MSEQKKIWMVRIEDHICGPFETAAVESLIQEQRISEIDEIAPPCKGWYYVRDRGEFLEVLDKIKSISFNKDKAVSSSGTGTEGITSLLKEDKTEEVSRISNDEGTKTAPLVEFDRLELGKNALGSNTLQNNQSLNRGMKVKLVFAVVFFGLILCAYFISSSKLGYNSLALLTGEGKKTFNISWQSGNYKKALKALQGSKSLIKGNRNKYAAILLMKANYFNRAEKALEQVIDKTSIEWKNLKGLSEQYKGEEDLAENYFLSVLKEDQNYIPSLVNLGLLKRGVGEWSLARSYFESAFSKVEENGFDDISFYLLEAWMRQSLAETGVLNLENINIYLQNQMVGHSTYMHELKLIELWISATRNRWVKKEEVLTKEILDLDPQILTERKQSPLTYKLQQGDFSYLCEDLNFKLKATKYKNSVIALCSVVNKEYDKAALLLKTEPENEWAVTLLSFVAGLKKDSLLADEQLVKAMEFTKNESFTKFFQQARFCYEKGDMKCAAEYWMKGLERDPAAYTAHTGLAMSYFQVEDYEKAQIFMQRAAVFTESYGPLIELQILMKDVKK